MSEQGFLSLPPFHFENDFWRMLQRETRPIVVYGMGNGADKLVDRLASYGKEVADFFASDGFVRGQSFRGKKVLSLKEIREKYEDFVILVSFGSHLDDVVNNIYSLADTNCLYIPDMPLADKEYFDSAFYQAHYEEIKEAYNLLADEASKAVFAAVVWYKLTAQPSFLKKSVCCEDEEALCGFQNIQTAVDVGAYRGDTLKQLLDKAPCIRCVYTIEPDEKNYKKLEAVATGVEGVTVYPIHAAAWKEDGEITFDSSGNRNAAVALSTANLSSFEHCTKTVPSVTIDSILQGKKADYIKYDTEGVEREALLGSERTISLYSPTLLVSAYHKSVDIFSLILWIERLHKGRYDFYLRRHNCIPAWDLNLIARRREPINEA